jgi:hypothetical protein
LRRVPLSYDDSDCTDSKRTQGFGFGEKSKGLHQMQYGKDRPMCFRPGDDLRKLITAAAKEADRSLNGEILHRLKRTFALDEASA